ncbi:MAG: UDP-N-acetylmuramoylalanyl-D-glutamyl-2, 6-diaminopimelate--D-alanyl-D-alanine ligase [Micavibrio sp.]|nr:UDP-N-acetylmuramoylalanyl-D-glutamyl-2, 6-diaminopimelate--D-alanyl-D-alanine ligase [Micavibrio sp.]
MTHPEKAPSSTLWTSSEAEKVTGGKSTCDWFAIGVSIDTRTLKQGDLFIALEGDNGNGHDYLAQAFEKGASAAVVSQVSGDQDKSFPLLVVNDTFKAMQDLGQGARDRTAAKVIAVTGSVGKTGTKEMLAAAFGKHGQTHAAIKSYNNHWGVPLTLSNMHAGTDYGVFEVGMNHPGEITPLSKQVKPDIAIITTVAPVHVEHFENGLEGIADAKAEIFDGLNSGGKALLNIDNEMFDRLSQKALAKDIDVVTFGKSEKADIRLMECLVASNGTRVKADIMGHKIAYTLSWSGEHIAMNSLAVLGAVKLSGCDIEKAARALENLTPPSGRGAREYLDIGDKDNPVTLIDESYNASPTAMKAAFKVLALIDPGRGGRRIAILGDMLELGKDSPKHHADLAMPLRAANVDLVYTCGKNMRNLFDAVPEQNRGAHKDTSMELAEIVPDVLVPGDVVMVKGSLGSKMNLVIETLRALPGKISQDKTKKV